MKLREAVLLGNAQAWGRLADYTRSKGGKYQDTYAWVCRIFKEAGKPAPSLPDFEEKMQEADHAATQP